MRTWSHGITLGIGLGLALAGACKDDDGTGSVAEDDAPERLAAEQCAAWFACDCTSFDDRYADEEECRTAVETAVQDGIDAGNEEMLTYHGACIGLWIDAIGAIDCQTDLQAWMNEDTVDAFRDLVGCKLFYGDRAAGETCETPPGVAGDTCQVDLACTNGICAVQIGGAAEGEPCAGLQCGQGLLCTDLDSDGELLCERVPGAGDTCLGVLDICDVGLYCEQADKTCTVLPAIGEPCGPMDTVRCAAGAVCDADQCVAAPGAGEPCTLVCDVGLECTNNVCAKGRPTICGDVGAG